MQRLERKVQIIFSFRNFQLFYREGKPKKKRKWMVFELLFLYMYLRICRSRNLVVFLYTIYDISFEIPVVPCSMEINNASQVSKHFQSLPVNTIFHIIHRFIYLFIYFPLSPYVHLLFICTKPFHSTNFFLHLSLRIRTCPSSHTY